MGRIGVERIALGPVTEFWAERQLSCGRSLSRAVLSLLLDMDWDAYTFLRQPVRKELLTDFRVGHICGGAFEGLYYHLWRDLLHGNRTLIVEDEFILPDETLEEMRGPVIRLTEETFLYCTNPPGPIDWTIHDGASANHMNGFVFEDIEFPPKEQSIDNEAYFKSQLSKLVAFIVSAYDGEGYIVFRNKAFPEQAAKK